MKTPFQVQLISPEQAYGLRHLVLRPHQPIEACHYPEDHSELSFHVGAFAEQKLIGVASFNPQKFQEFLANNSCRLRGMATSHSHQKLGVGRAVLTFGLQELRKRNCDVLWFNARLIAFPFYERMGFLYASEVFDIAGIGPHKIMYKSLAES